MCFTQKYKNKLLKIIFITLASKIFVFSCFSQKGQTQNQESQMDASVQKKHAGNHENTVNPESAKDIIFRQASELKYNALCGACALFLIFLIVYECQVDHMPESLKAQFYPKNLALNFLSTYFMNFACTFFHELGHGVAKKILTGSDFKIHLGNEKNGEDQSIIDSKFLSIDGIDSLLGYNVANDKNLKYNKLQKIIINISGGVSGILGYYLLRTIIFFVYNICDKNFDGSLFKKETFGCFGIFKKSLFDAISFDQIVVKHLVDMLVPMQNDKGKLVSDAAKIWRDLGVKDANIHSIAKYQDSIAMLLSIIAVFKQANSNCFEKKYFADKILIGLANYFLQGFMTFKSA